MNWIRRTRPGLLVLAATIGAGCELGDGDTGATHETGGISSSGGVMVTLQGGSSPISSANGGTYAVVTSGGNTSVVMTGGCTQTSSTVTVGQWERWAGDMDAGTPQPSARGYHAMAWGSINGSAGALLFGGGSINFGVLSDAWTFDPLAQAWSKAPRGPKPRGGASLNYMPELVDDAGATGEFVLFGGEGASIFGDTWLFRDAGWSTLCSGTVNQCTCGPCPRAYHAATYDAVRRELVMFGGRDDDAAFQDTWILSADRVWSERCHVPCSEDAGACCAMPSPRSEHAMAFDYKREVVVLFGGKSADGMPLGDTWEWDGTQWALREPLHAPERRSGHVMASGPNSSGVVLFGGIDSDYSPIETLWYWDGTDWNKISVTGQTPQSRAFGAMTSDATGSSLLLFGGGTAGDMNDTWSLTYNYEVVTTCGGTPSVSDGGLDASSLTGTCAQLARCCHSIPTSSPGQLCGFVVAENNNTQCEQELQALQRSELCD